MSFVVENSSTDRVANEHTPCMAEFVGGFIELAKRLFVNLEQYRNRVVFLHMFQH